MKLRIAMAWASVGVVIGWGCDNPRVAPVMPPGVEAPRVAPPTAAGSGAEALGETPGAANAGGQTTPALISEPTQVGQERKTASGLTYVTEREGTGPMARPGQTVTIKYVGRLENGTKFFDTADKGGPVDVPIGVGHNLKGLDEGVAGMKVGEKRKLIMPGHLGYGAEGQKGVVPENATLVFEVELVGVK